MQQRNVTAGSSWQPPSAQHRARLAVYVQAILGGFWHDNTTPDAVRAVELQGWLDVIDVLSEDEVRRAWAEYQKSGPRSRSGRLLRPDAGAIRDLAMVARAAEMRMQRAALPPPAEPQRVRVTKEQTAAILAAVSYNPRRFDDLPAEGGAE